MCAAFFPERGTMLKRVTVRTDSCGYSAHRRNVIVDEAIKTGLVETAQIVQLYHAVNKTFNKPENTR